MWTSNAILARLIEQYEDSYDLGDKNAFHADIVNRIPSGTVFTHEGKGYAVVDQKLVIFHTAREMR